MRVLDTTAVFLSLAAIGLQPARAADDIEDEHRGQPVRFGRKAQTPDFTITVNGAWGTSVTGVSKLDVQPFGAGVGGRLDFTFKAGVRLGAYATYFFGGSKLQQSVALNEDVALQLDANFRALLGGIGVGFDDDLGPLVLRYALDFGLTRLSWDYGGGPFVPGRYGRRRGTTTVFHLAPGFGVLVPFGLAFASVDLRYFLHNDDRVPSGVAGFAGTGLRF